MLLLSISLSNILIAIYHISYLYNIFKILKFLILKERVKENGFISIEYQYLAEVFNSEDPTEFQNLLKNQPEDLLNCLGLALSEVYKYINICMYVCVNTNSIYIHISTLTKLIL